MNVSVLNSFPSLMPRNALMCPHAALSPALGPRWARPERPVPRAGKRPDNASRRTLSPAQRAVTQWKSSCNRDELNNINETKRNSLRVCTLGNEPYSAHELKYYYTLNITSLHALTINTYCIFSFNFILSLNISWGSYTDK